MIKKTILVAVAIAAISSIASAEDKAATAPATKPAAPKADAAATADAPKIEAPKPPAENDMFKKVAGTWRCDSISTGPDGKDMKVKTTWTWKNVLGGQWYTVVYKRTKTGPVPAFEGNATMGYNGAEKKYVFVGFDNMGGWINLSSADGMSYAGKGNEGAVKIAFAKGKDKKGEDNDKMMNVSLDLAGHPISETCKR
ncbi:MAG TPA: DUF1579 family protein [Polyangia bacterium]|jgi:hypothetical protein|nr:DUF1579 family protein [Polyangia bacterium]